jgi:hypothetical protein
VVNPFEEVSAGLIAHAVGELAGEGALGEESGDVTAEESFGVVGERPIELWCAHMAALN